MADNKTVTQTLKLDNKEFIGPLNQARAAAKSATDDINKDLTNNSKSFQQNESQVKKWGGTISSELQKASRAALENLKTGAKALTLGAGASLIKSGAQNVIEDTIESSKKLAEVSSRFSASKGQVEQWSDSINKAAISSKISISSMTSAFSELADSVDDPSKILEFKEALGMSVSMNGGESKGVTDYLKATTTGQGKEMNKANVEESLRAANLLQRNGKGFASQGDAMKAISGLDANSVKASGLSQTNIAALLAGASKSGVGTDVATSGINALLQETGQGVYSKLAQKLGIGSFQGKDGKLDLSKLAQGNAQLDRLGNDEKTRLKTFKDTSELGDKESEAVFNFIRHSNDFAGAMNKAEKDTKTFGQSFKESSNNLKDNIQGLQTNIEVGLSDIFKGFKDPLNDLIQGKFGAAAGGVGHGLAQAGSGIMDHPALVGGAALTVLGGGALLTSLLSKIGGGGIAGLAGGVAKGKALEKAGITPVYVTNANEFGGPGATPPVGGIASTALPFLKKMGALIGAAGTTLGAVGATGVGALASTGAAGLATIGGGVAAAGAAGYGIGLGINVATDAIGNKFDISSLGAAIYDLIDKLQTQKVELKITKPKGFSVEPSADDNQTDSRH